MKILKVFLAASFLAAAILSFSPAIQPEGKPAFADPEPSTVQQQAQLQPRIDAAAPAAANR